MPMSAGIASSSFVWLASATAGGSAASLSVSVPSGYKTLMVRYNMVSASGSSNGLDMRFNADSGANYSIDSAVITTTLTGTQTSGTTYVRVGTCSTNNNQMGVLFIKNVSTDAKGVTGHSYNGDNSQSVFGGVWSNTSNEISAIALVGDAANINTGSFIEVWGLKDS